MNYVYENELYHHGIDGQKWGDRNGPPYPLNYKAHSAAEKREMRAQKHEASEARKDEKIRAANEKAKVKASDQARQLERSRIKFETANIKKDTKLSRKQFKAQQNQIEDERKAKEREANFAKKKAKIIERANIQEAAKYADLFTTQELTEIINKYEKVTKVKELSSKGKKNATDSLKQIVNTVGTIGEGIGKASTVVENTKKMIKALDDSEPKKKWKTVQKWDDKDLKWVNSTRTSES